MMEARTLGRELQRVRTKKGLSIEGAAAIAQIAPDVWAALEAERSDVFLVSPTAYATAARALLDERRPLTRDEVAAVAALPLEQLPDVDLDPLDRAGELQPADALDAGDARAEGEDEVGRIGLDVRPLDADRVDLDREPVRPEEAAAVRAAERSVRRRNVGMNFVLAG